MQSTTDFEIIQVGGVDQSFKRMMQSEPGLKDIMHANMSFSSTGFSLRLSMPDVTPFEIASFSAPGGVPFAFREEDGLLVGYAKFGDAIEIEFSYNARGLLNEPSLWPKEQMKGVGGNHWLLDMILIEATTARVLAMRSGTLSPEVSIFCLDNIQRQLESGGIDSQTAQMALARLTARYPTITKAMQSCTVKCKTGD